MANNKEKRIRKRRNREERQRGEVVEAEEDNVKYQEALQVVRKFMEEEERKE
jgi:hypothetical protein